MNRKRWFLCGFSVALACTVLFLLLNFLAPRLAEAQNNSSNPPATITQYPDDHLVVIPNPPLANWPTEIRTYYHNEGPNYDFRYAQFFYSRFGIGNPRIQLSSRLLVASTPWDTGSAGIVWVPPDAGPFCFYVDIYDGPEDPLPMETYQHNMIFNAHPEPFAELYTKVVSFTVLNPLTLPATFMLQMAVDAPGWQGFIEPGEVVLQPGQAVLATANFSYSGTGQLPEGGTEIFWAQAFADQLPVGGVEIVFGPPLRLHTRAEPGYAESEISVSPYPVPPGEPAEICAEVRNVTNEPREAIVFFAWAPFGIAMPFEPAAPPVHIVIPELGMRRPCIHWVAPEGGQFAFEVQVETPGFPLRMASQRVLDVNEVLLPGTTSELLFPVRNPFPQPVTITLGLIPHIEDWGFSLSQDVLPNMGPDEIRFILLTATPGADAIMPPDGSPVVDVEAFVGREPIGGFRKIYRPPVPIHQPGDPIYAEREITISPYPPREHEPTQICADVRNPTDVEQMVDVDFKVAEFGIGLPWQPVHSPIPTILPPHSMVKVCTMWVPPFGGRFGVEVGITMDGQDRFYSQRVIDVGEILLPNQPSPFEFVVRNPFNFPILVTMGAIRYLPQWEVSFNTPEFVLQPGQPVPVVMTVVPVQNPGDPEPQEGQPVIDVEAYWHGNGEHGLLGGFRKLFFPPIPIHRPEDPPYAEREINIFPYPPQAGEPTRLEFEARNPTTATQQISVTFEWGNLGIGLPFTPINGPQVISLHPDQVGVVGIMWVPPFGGEFCIRVKVEAPFFQEPFYSARNISIVRLPEPYGTPEEFMFVVGDNGNTTRPLTITLGLKTFLPNWQVTLDMSQIVLQPGQNNAIAVMTLTPPPNPDDLPIDGGPVADVSGYMDGNLIGGIRKVWRPPVPLGQIGEPSYAESEIVINPDPPIVGQPATFSAQVRNNSAYTQTINLQFGWANFGFGIAFTTTNVVPTQTQITLGPYMTTTVSSQWTPPYSGNFCVQILLLNLGTQEELKSQRNVNAIEVPESECETITQEIWLYNTTSLVVTVTMGLNPINLPPGWTYSVDPEWAVLQPYQGITITLVITPPCNLLTGGWILPLEGLDADNPTKIQVEGYDQYGDLIGGIELQLLPPSERYIYLPVIWRVPEGGE